jgi:hypothetical protein
VRQVLVRYKVKPEEAAHNEELVRQVFAELQRTAPAGIHYATFVQEDGVSFVHVAITDTLDDGRSRLWEVAAFRAFQEGVEERWEEPAQSVPLREIGSYGFWSEATVR